MEPFHLPASVRVWVMDRGIPTEEVLAEMRAMRQRRLKWLWKRLKELHGMKLHQEDLLMKLGAARQQAPSAWRLVEVGGSYRVDSQTNKRR